MWKDQAFRASLQTNDVSAALGSTTKVVVLHRDGSEDLGEFIILNFTGNMVGTILVQAAVNMATPSPCPGNGGAQPNRTRLNGVRATILSELRNVGTTKTGWTTHL